MTGERINDIVLYTGTIHAHGFMALNQSRLAATELTAGQHDDTEKVLKDLCFVLECSYEDYYALPTRTSLSISDIDASETALSPVYV